MEDEDLAAFCTTLPHSPLQTRALLYPPPPQVEIYCILVNSVFGVYIITLYKCHSQPCHEVHCLHPGLRKEALGTFLDIFFFFTLEIFFGDQEITPMQRRKQKSAGGLEPAFPPVCGGARGVLSTSRRR